MMCTDNQCGKKTRSNTCVPTKFAVGNQINSTTQLCFYNVLPEKTVVQFFFVFNPTLNVWLVHLNTASSDVPLYSFEEYHESYYYWPWLTLRGENITRTEKTAFDCTPRTRHTHPRVKRQRRMVILSDNHASFKIVYTSEFSSFLHVSLYIIRLRRTCNRNGMR